EQQQDFHANLAEKHRGEANNRTTELLAAKDLLLQATGRASTIENRLVQMESKRDALENLQEQSAAQVKAVAQLQAQCDALVMERRTLHETLQTLREQHMKQVK